MHRADTNYDAIRERHGQIDGGIKEAIRREVERRRELGLPIHAARDGSIGLERASVLAKRLLFAFTLAQVAVYLLPAVIKILTPGSGVMTLEERFSLHAWLAVFWTANIAIFWLSMQSATKKPYLDTIGDWVVAAQIAGMLFGGSLIFQMDPTCPVIPPAGGWFRWGLALVFFALMNILALYHSWENIKRGEYGKAVTWTLMDLGAASFYVLILSRVPSPAMLEPPMMFFLWPWVVCPLMVLVFIDISAVRLLRRLLRMPGRGEMAAGTQDAIRT